MKELINRLKAETPDFFKKVRSIAIYIASGATAAWTANSTMGLNLPETLLDVFKYIIVAAAFTGVTAQLTKTDK